MGIDTNTVVLIVVLFTVFFTLFWTGVVWLMSRVGGWHKLAEKYRAQGPFDGPKWYLQGGRMGLVNYRGTLTVGLGEQGLYLAVLPPFQMGHSPLWIPWNEIEITESGQSLWFYVGLRFAQEPSVTLWLRGGVGRRILEAHDGMGGQAS